MPEKRTIQRARKKKAQGQAASSQAGEFVREEMHHVREGKHGARSTKQAIAIGLSKARRAGVDLPPPEEGTTSERTRKSAERAYRKGRRGGKRGVSPRRSRAVTRALKREGHGAATTESLRRQAKSAAKERTAEERSEAAQQAVETKGAAELRAAARKAARTRERQRR